MPHANLRLIPGVDRNRTEALNEAAIWDCNLIRFVPDRQGQALAQPIGGWVKFKVSGESSLPTFTSPVRSIHAWADVNGQNRLAIGTEDQLYANGVISPQFYSYGPTLNVTSTVGSPIITITDTGSNVSSFDSIFLQTQISVGGLILFGYYPCIAVGSNSFQITATNVLGQSVNATTTAAAAMPVFDATSGSQNILVTLTNHGYSNGDTFPILLQVDVGGINLLGNFEVYNASANTFLINSSNSASSTQTVTLNGGVPYFTYYVGSQSIPPPSGYNSGNYGYGGYGGVGVSASGRQVTIVNITQSLGVATGTLSESITIPANSTMTISSSSATQYNQQWTVSTLYGDPPGTFTFSVPDTFPATSTGGTGVINKWGYVPPNYDPVASYTSYPWTLDNWGEYLVASPQEGPIFYWDPTGGSTDAIIMPNSPHVSQGFFVAMPERQIIAYGTSFNGIKDPLLVRWCDIGNFTSWVGTVTNQAGSFRIPKGSKIVGGIQGPQQGYIWTDLSLWSMQYINLPLVYSFNEIATGCGLIGQRATGTVSGVTYWMSQSQFFKVANDGVEIVPCPVWDMVFQNIDMNYTDNIRCAPNSRFGEIGWFYPTLNNAGTTLEGVPTNYVKFNTLTGQWDFGVLTRTAWIDQSVFGPPIAAYQTVGPVEGIIYQHERGQTDAGDPILAYLQTGYFALEDGNNQMFVDQVWPDMKWSTVSDEVYGGSAIVNITFDVVDYPGETPRTYSFDVTKDTKFITPRIRGRLMSMRVGGANFWRLGNIRYRFQPDGKF